MGTSTGAGISDVPRVETLVCYPAVQVNFGKPQAYASLLLLAFVLQCVWLMTHTPVSGAELQHHTSEPVPSTVHSPLTSTLATLPGRLVRVLPDASSPFWWISLRICFMGAGALLGAAVWYIARRLYGNAGGYIALTLYCFSPAMVAHSSTVAPDILAAFGAFGTFWTAIATAHTLYAPREVVLWNWKRIALLAMALALGVGAQFAVVLVALLGLMFMFYLVPHRLGAALAIMGSAIGLALLPLLSFYGFRASVFAHAIFHARWAEFSSAAVVHAAPWKMVGFFVLGNSPGLTLLLTVALVTFITWRRARYFGNTAPLVTTIAVIVILLVMPQAAGFSFLIVMLPFALVFVAGVCVDLLEAKNLVVRSLATGIIIAVLITHALFSVMGLRRLSPAPVTGSGPHAGISY